MTRQMAQLMRMYRSAVARNDLLMRRLVAARIHALWAQDPSAWWAALHEVYAA